MDHWISVNKFWWFPPEPPELVLVAELVLVVFKGPPRILEVKLLTELDTRLPRGLSYKIRSMHFDSCAFRSLTLPCKISNTSIRLAVECVSMLKFWIVVTWDKMIGSWKTQSEVIRWCSTKFGAKTHLVWRGFHRQNDFPSPCLEVFGKIRFGIFWNLLCTCRLNLSRRTSIRVSWNKFGAISRYVSWRIFWPKIASCSRKKVFGKTLRLGIF